MKKSEVLHKIKKDKLVAVIRGESINQAMKIVESVVAGGINIIEVTLTIPSAITMIKKLAESYHETDVIIGAGTVLDGETANDCIIAGAQFIVSPAYDQETMVLCNKYDVPYIPGIMTPSEAIKALKGGTEILKLFPGNMFSPNIIKTLNGPLPQARFMPSGGVTLDNVVAWIEQGAVAVSIGSTLTNSAKVGNYELIEDLAKKFVYTVSKI